MKYTCYRRCCVQVTAGGGAHSADVVESRLLGHRVHQHGQSPLSVTFSSALANFCRSRSSSSELKNILGTGRTEIVRVDDAGVSKKSLNCSSERKCLRRPGTELTDCEYTL